MLTDEEIKGVLKTSGICAPEVFDEYCAKPAGWLIRFARNIERATTRKVIEHIADWHEKEGWLLDEDDVPAAIRALLPDDKERA